MTTTSSSTTDDISLCVLKEHYYMPGEFRQHAACLILYPHNPATYPLLDQAQREVRDMARAIAHVGNERVILLVLNADEQKELQQILLKEEADQAAASSVCQRIDTLVCPSNDTWARDTAPTFVIVRSSSSKEEETGENSKEKLYPMIGVDWDFNAYGGPETGAYWPCHLDQQLASTICHLLSSSSSTKSLPDAPELPLPDLIPSVKVPLVLEGGSIHSDGQGTILTTKECLLNPNRNPHLSQDQIEQKVLEATTIMPDNDKNNQSKMIWLPNGVDGDEDTNGHIDNWACFVEPAHVVLSWTDDYTDDKVNYDRCREACEILEATTDAQGRPFKVSKLYLPSPPLYYSSEVAELQQSELQQQTTTTKEGDDNTDGCNKEPSRETAVARQSGQRMAASYINFYIANEAIIVPQYGGTAEEWDKKATETLQELYPHYKVVGVASRNILMGGGNIHCMTQQVPLPPSS